MPLPSTTPRTSRPSRDGTDVPYEIRKSHIQGRGAFATRRIRAGTRIDEYVGERISRDEADRRYDDQSMARHHTWLFAVEDEVVIDAAVGGNASRFINHSCEPNCEAIIEDARVFIYALKNIQPGVELTYDYAYERHEDHDESDELFYACRCGAPTCRGTILAPKKPNKANKPKKPNKRRGPR
jgi:uncharacterized protein